MVAKIRIVGIVIFISFFLSLLVPQFAAASLSSWKISCSVDKGAIKKKGRNWVFKPSSNRCGGSKFFKQRSELRSGNFSANRKGTYKFQSYITMKTSKSEKYDIFQIHDGRSDCSPPLKVTVSSSGKLNLISDFKKGAKCIRSPLSNKSSSRGIKRNGTEQLLEVLVNFDGQGGFLVSVSIDGSKQISGKYTFREGEGFFKSKFFYFKHGVYSRRIFDYELRSRNMRVRRSR